MDSMGGWGPKRSNLRNRYQSEGEVHTNCPFRLVHEPKGVKECVEGTINLIATQKLFHFGHCLLGVVVRAGAIIRAVCGALLCLKDAP